MTRRRDDDRPHPARRRGRGGLGCAVTHDDLSALMRDIAEAAARCVGADPLRTEPHVGIHGPYFSARRQSVELAARAGDWRVKGSAVGSTVQTANPALNAAAVLALRERLTAQAEERWRLLAADEAALRVLDAEARLYDAATVAEACGVVARDGQRCTGADDLRSYVLDDLRHEPPPWTRHQLRLAACSADVAAACDAILRRRAGGEP